MLRYCFILIGLLVITVFLIKPSTARRAKNWGGTLFAHRGLHSDKVTENTLEAFELACQAGYGIELDVQFSRDGKVIVFHDPDLKRMAGDPRKVLDVDYDELRQIELIGGGHIPLFEEVLETVNGRVPMLIEIKTAPKNSKLCAETMRLLEGYKGAYIMESFNPMVISWLRRKAPQVIRGQLVSVQSDYLAAHITRIIAWMLSSLSFNFLGRPDFVAYDVSDSHFKTPKIQRKLFHVPMAAWTVRDKATCTSCLERGEMPIFEGFLP